MSYKENIWLRCWEQALNVQENIVTQTHKEKHENKQHILNIRVWNPQNSWERSTDLTQKVNVS